ncbi:MAG: hypothetical protein QXL89_03365 [Nitrososphaeria archaeon]
MSTIPVSLETKKKLKSMKGSKTWDSFLDELANIALSEKRLAYRKRMQDLLEMDYDDTRVRGWAREY